MSAPSWLAETETETPKKATHTNAGVPRSPAWRAAQSRSLQQHYAELRARGLPLQPTGPDAYSWKGGCASYWKRQARAVAFAVYGRQCCRCPATQSLVVVSTHSDKTHLDPAYLRVYCRSCHGKLMNERGMQKPARETCKRGHPFAPENTLTYPRPAGQQGVKRICRICNALRATVAWKKQRTPARAQERREERSGSFAGTK